MKINKQLFLVNEIEGENGTIHVHSAPISSETYKLFWKVLSKTWSTIHAQGFAAAGARTAHLELEESAKQLRVWEGDDGVENHLIPEMHRLTNVIINRGTGFETIPYTIAMKDGLIAPDDADEIEAALVFFTASYRTYRRDQRETIMAASLAFWGCLITSYDCTAYANFLTTSPQDANSGKSAT